VLVKMVLEREDVNPNPVATIYGLTESRWSLSTSRKGASKRLSDMGGYQSYRARIKGGPTPQSWAAESGYRGYRSRDVFGTRGHQSRPPKICGYEWVQQKIFFWNEKMFARSSQITGTKPHCPYHWLSPKDMVEV